MHVQHSDNCSCTLKDCPQNPAYPKKILCYALVDIVRSGQKVKSSELLRRLQEYIPWQLTPSFVTKTKKAAQAVSLSNSSSRQMCVQQSPTKIANTQNAMLYQFIAKLHTAGHKVNVTTQTGATLREFVIDAARKAHIEHQKDKQPQDKVPFNAQLTKESDSDWAHVKGWIGGNMFSLVANDANHHVCHLVIGYVAGNETAESWKIALDFAKQNLPSFDVAHQVLLTDGSKGAADAMSTFDHAHH